MKKKSKRTKGIEEARPFEGLSKVNENAAGVDIGATEIVACVSGGEEVQLVRAFGNYTVDLYAICEWFHEHGVKTVAMESTGVYWIPLFEELERQGFECLLISSRSLRKVAGQKTDVEDAQWIQTLHSYGLLKGSFRPQGDLVALRTLLRHRAQLLEHRAPHIQHMQKALLQMNIQLTQAVTDVMGVTGQKIIRMILMGERNPETLAALRAEGTVQVQSETHQVSGLAWKDHEFSTGVLDEGQIGWDWFSLQFDDGSALMLFQLRESDGGTSDSSSGTLINTDGLTQSLQNENFSITVLDQWRSPHTGGMYPSAWQIQLEEPNCRLDIRPWMPDQEVNFPAVTYWEGAVRFEGTCAGKSVNGNGYIELTGYAGSLPLP
ncbi:MAG: lipocalin family protein [Chloroflexota bacterium]